MGPICRFPSVVWDIAMSTISDHRRRESPPPPVALAAEGPGGSCRDSSPLVLIRGLRKQYWNHSAFLRISRYRLQSIARSIMVDRGLTYCLRSLISGNDPSVSVEVWGRPGKAHYRNLQRCGLVWLCPVCAAVISERRRSELARGFASWAIRGGGMAHLILTVPHHQGQGLSGLVQGFSVARRILLNGKRWKRLCARIGLVGSIRGLEVTYGENGWHVHSHEGLFLPGAFYRSGRDDPYSDALDDHLDSLKLAELEGEILGQWQSACLSARMDRPGVHGVRLQDGRTAAGYLSKWGLESEITKGHSKKARGGNMGPWDMLRAVGEGRDECRGLFREFGLAFRGRKQLEWSRGMRAVLGLDIEETDGGISREIDQDELFYASLTRREWFYIYSTENRGELLEVAARSGREGVLRFVEELVGRRAAGG